MPQIFQPSSNTIARAGIFVVMAGLFFVAWGLDAVYWSSYSTRQNVPIQQPVLFSHEHHVSVLGIDCRYCHTSVEKSAFAGLPETEICMTCHSQLFTEEPMLALVRQSLAENKPMRWRRVNDLPDFVYFNHSIHVAKGIGCAECHGRVDQMPLTAQAHPLYMKWCLDCHRAPENFIRPREKVFAMDWQRDDENTAQGVELLKKYHVMSPAKLTDCSRCHR
jgi:hypothetical protein